MATDARRWGDVRIPHAGAVAVAGVVVTTALLLYLSRRFTFQFDDWDFLMNWWRWSPGDYFVPHNEHWSTIPKLVWAALLATVGARSYLPFMAAVLAVHGAVVVLVFALVRHRAGDLLALLSAALMLLLGRGQENILWAFQLGFDGSIAFGLAGLVVIDRDVISPARAASAAALLVLGLLCSGVGLFFLVIAGAALALGRRFRTLAVVVGPPLLVYLVWFAVVGRSHATVHRSPVSRDAVQSLIDYVPYGIGSAAAGLAGLGMRWTEVGFGALVAVVLIAALRGGTRQPLLAGLVLGVLAQYTLTGLVRGQFGVIEAASSRYVYITASMLLPVLTWVAAEIPWREPWRAGMLAVAVLAIGYNGYQLDKAIVGRNSFFAVEDAELQVAYLVRDAPGLKRDAALDPFVLPTVSEAGYLEARAHAGTTVSDITASDLGSLPPAGVNAVLTNLFPLATSQSGTHGGSACALIDPDVGYLDRAVPDGGAVRIDTEYPARVTAIAWVSGPAPAGPVHELNVPPQESVRLSFPRTGQPIAWHVRISAPPYGRAEVCDA